MPLFVVPPDLLLAGDPILCRIPGGFNVPPRRLAYGPPLAFGPELGRVLSAGARAFVSAVERSLSGAYENSLLFFLIAFIDYGWNYSTALPCCQAVKMTAQRKNKVKKQG